MAKIKFRAKVETVRNLDGSVAYQRIRVPVLDRKHCDMHAFRMHPTYGPYANSDLFRGMLAHIRKDLLGPYRDYIRLDAIPDGVTVDTSGFLALVSWEV